MTLDNLQWLVLAVLLLFPAAYLQAASSPLRLAGRVEDEQGQAVADVLVEAITGLAPITARSGSDGRFTITIGGPQPHVSGLRAISADGARQAWFNPYAPNLDLENIRLVLRPVRELAVTVADAQSQSIADAVVILRAGFLIVAEATTDAAGKANLRFPADAPLRDILALKNGVGLDYHLFWAKDQPKTDPYRLPHDHADPVSFILNGVTPIKVRVVDNDDRPLPGVRVLPWYFQKPKKGEDLNIGGIPVFDRLTDEHGIATFDMIPADVTDRITFWARLDGYCAPERFLFDPAAGKPQVEAKLLRQIPITGRVVDAQGRPAPAATVRVAGDGYSFDGFRMEEVTTDANGVFSLRVNPELFYIFSATKDQLASRAAFQIVRSQPPANPVELKLEPTTLLRVRITSGADRAAVPNAYVTLMQHDYEAYYKLPKDQQFPGGTTGRKAITPALHQNAKTDDRGIVEFRIAPGQYTVDAYQLRTRLHENFTLSDTGEYAITRTINHRETEETHPVLPTGIEIPLHFADNSTEPKVLKGRVVLRDKPETSIPEASLRSASTGNGYIPPATADAQGNFNLVRGDSDLYLLAEHPDKSLRGIILVKPTDNDVIIPIGPTASAVGRLFDHEGNAIANRGIDFGIRVFRKGGGFSSFFGSSTKTAADGSFRLDGLVPGFEYLVNVVMEVGDDGRPRSWNTAAAAKAVGAEIVQLGDLKLRPPYKPKTAADYCTEAFAKTEPLDQRLQKANHIARLSLQHLLVMLGSARRSACQQLFELCYDRENGDVAAALAEHALLALDAETANPAAHAWAERLQIPWPTNGMTLAILDPAGKLLGHTSDASLSSGGKLDRAALIAFLSQHAPAKPDAQKLLDDALTRAARENKLVLLKQGGPNCPWCVKLTEYIEANRALLEKDLVCITIDRRFPNAVPILDRLREKNEFSVPWMAILTPDGKPLITSDGPGGNIGYPSDAASQAHWQVMLRAAATHLTEAEITQLIQALRSK